MTAIHIRAAQPSDLDTIVAFINALAHYEELADQVTGNPEDLRQDLFGELQRGRPPLEVIFAELEDVIVGFALFFPNYSTFQMRPGLFLEDLFVLPEYRKRGVGRSLFQYLARLAVDRHYGRFEWRVLDWNNSAIRFYQSMGATILPEWYTCRLDEQGLAELAARSLI